MVLTTKDRLTGVFVRYPKLPPDPKNSKLPTPPPPFELPDFLEPIVASEPKRDQNAPDARTRGWQLLMQGVVNLALGEFPRLNGWKDVSTRPCPLIDARDEKDKGVRVVFGTDRKAKEEPPSWPALSPMPIPCLRTSRAMNCIWAAPMSCRRSRMPRGNAI